MAHASENESICAAIKEAHGRLEKARQHEAREADRKNALEARKVVEELVEHGQTLDDALHDMVEAGHHLKTCFDRLGQLGISSPRYEQLATFGNLAILSALGRSTWKRYHETLAPNQRKSFVDVVAAWRGMILQEVERRLGEPQQEHEAA